MATPLFQELLQAARAAGIEVRHAPLGGSGGGLARLKGKRLLFVDIDAEAEDQLEKTLGALASLPEVLQQPLSERLRHLIQTHERNA